MGGRRISDMQYYFEKLQETSHDPLFQFNFSNLTLLGEKGVGLISFYSFECNLCKKTFQICSDDTSNTTKIDVNSKLDNLWDFITNKN